MEAQPPLEETEQQQPERKYKGNHPVAAAFHISWKIAVIFLYFFFGNSRFTLTFVLVTLLSAADFWTVKNVTGRLMVALRWWNEVGENGQNIWHFESGNISKVNPYDAKFFWLVLVGYEILWVLFTLAAIISISKLRFVPLCILVLAINGANCLGYVKCRKDAKKHAEDYFKQNIAPSIFSAVATQVTKQWAKQPEQASGQQSSSSSSAAAPPPPTNPNISPPQHQPTPVNPFPPTQASYTPPPVPTGPPQFATPQAQYSAATSV
eukprot:TRINITY_DN31309_c0_g1_i1.p1 TRINITY_DN31309_c0_g1~~TRINITY_DN31309_c0_g1_i1.p1  ORF type:complete len:275 (+),score=38.66 TRINITY_DN31309_c0_g1_i1:31-825(+)